MRGRRRTSLAEIFTLGQKAWVVLKYDIPCVYSNELITMKPTDTFTALCQFSVSTSLLTSEQRSQLELAALCAVVCLCIQLALFENQTPTVEKEKASSRMFCII